MELTHKQLSLRGKIGGWRGVRVIREGLCRANMYAESSWREGASQMEKMGRDLQAEGVVYTEIQRQERD